MSKVLVSLIVPIYNAEKYISRCIESILGQTYADFELILVDDGSTDDSYEICEEYQKHDNRIRLFKKEHSGACFSRLQGIEKARGEHICFVDADDTISQEFLEKIVKNKNYDLTSSNIVLHKGERKTVLLKSSIEPGIYNTEKKMDKFIKDMILYGNSENPGLIVSMSGKLFKKPIIETIIGELNPEIRYGEDREFVYRYVLKCKSIKMCDFAYYHYYENFDSSTFRFDPEFFIDVNKLRISLENVFSDNPNEEVLLEKLHKQMRTIYLHGLRCKLGYKSELIVKYVPRFVPRNVRKVAVYGAGIVGQNYIEYFRKYGDVTISKWVDAHEFGKTLLEMDIEEPSTLASGEFDCVFVAIKDDSQRQEALQNLLSFGISPDKVISDKPVSL